MDIGALRVKENLLELTTKLSSNLLSLAIFEKFWLIKTKESNVKLN